MLGLLPLARGHAPSFVCLVVGTLLFASCSSSGDGTDTNAKGGTANLGGEGGEGASTTGGTSNTAGTNAGGTNNTAGTSDNGGTPDQGGGGGASGSPDQSTGGAGSGNEPMGGAGGEPAVGLCLANEHVVSNECVACDPGSASRAGADPSGADTTCDAIVCNQDEHVVSHACVSCDPGKSRPAGDNATGGDTACSSILCGANQRVASHTCQACDPGSTNAAGDVASGADTQCDRTLCGKNEFVQNHACLACAAGSTNPAGDDATLGNTKCEITLCGQDQYVKNHACVACDINTTNAPGDEAVAQDTVCDGTAYNVAFVSPVPVTGDLGGRDAADVQCGKWADAAGYKGTFRALLSTTAEAASTRLGGARGWIRPDKRPVTDLASDMFDGQRGVLTPIKLDPSGNDLGPKFVYTGSNSAGNPSSGDCQGWKSADKMDSARMGYSDVTAEWLDGGIAPNCATSAYIYCFQIDYYTPLHVSDFAEAGRHLFPSNTYFDVASGVDGADKICEADAGKVKGLTGTYAAFLGSNGHSASERFMLDARAVIRLDGLLIADSLALLTTKDLITPPALQPDGSYWNFRVWTGAVKPDAKGTLGNTCDDWGLTTGNGEIGFAYATALSAGPRQWFNYNTDSCNNRNKSLPVYCLEQ